MLVMIDKVEFSVSFDCTFSNICYQPLFYNSDLACEDRCCKSVPISSFCKAGITTVRDIIDLNGGYYTSAEVLSLRVGINSVRIASNAIKEIVSCFKESWTHCINFFFTDDNYQFFEYDPDVTLSVLANHAELTLACVERKAFYKYHSALQQMMIYREDSGVQSLA